MIVEVTLDIEFIWDGFESHQLPQRCQSLHSGKLGGGKVALKLEKLQLDLQQIAFAHIADFEARLADADRLLKAVCVLFGQLHGGFREQYRNELLSSIKNQGTLT